MNHLKHTLFVFMTFLTFNTQASKSQRVEVGGIAIKVPGHAVITHHDVKQFALGRYSSVEHQQSLFISANRDYDSYRTLLNAWFEIHKNRALQERAEYAALLVEAKSHANNKGLSSHTMFFEFKDIESIISALDKNCSRFADFKNFSSLNKKQIEKAKELMNRGYPHRINEQPTETMNRYCAMIYNQSQELLRNKAALDYVVYRNKFDPIFSTFLEKKNVYNKIKQLGKKAPLSKIYSFTQREPMSSLYIKNVISYANTSPQKYAELTNNKSSTTQDLIKMQNVFSRESVQNLFSQNLDVVQELYSMDDGAFKNARKNAYKSFLIDNNPTTTYQWKLYQLTHSFKEAKQSPTQEFQKIHKKILETSENIKNNIHVNLEQTLDSLVFVGFLEEFSKSDKKSSTHALIELFKWSLNLRLHAALENTIGVIEYHPLEDDLVNSLIKDKFSQKSIDDEKKKAFEKNKKDIWIKQSEY